MSNSSLLREISQLSSLAASLSIFSVAVMLVIYELKRKGRDAAEISKTASELMTTTSGRSMNTSGNYARSVDSPGGRLTINLMTAVLAIASGCLFLQAISREVPHPSSITLHDVHVLSRLDPYNFVVDAPDANGQRVQFAITSCPDLMPTDEIRAGIRLKWINYVEDRAHHCQELDGPVSGYALERDNHNVPIVHDWSTNASAGSPSSSVGAY